MSFVEEAGDSTANQEMHSEGDEGIKLEESNNKGRRCRSPQYVGREE